MSVLTLSLFTMTGTCTQLIVAFPDAVVINWSILFIILLSQNVMHSVLLPLLNLSHTTTWTGFVTLYNTWLAGVWGRAVVLWTTLLIFLISHPLITVSLDHFRSTWQKALDISLHYAGLQALVACGVKWLNINGDYEEMWCVPSAYPCAMYMLKTVWSCWLLSVCYPPPFFFI